MRSFVNLTPEFAAEILRDGITIQMEPLWNYFSVIALFIK